MLNATTSAVRRLCVSIAGATPTEALALAKKSEAVADVIEIRLDSMTHPDIPLFLNGLSKPLLFTNRPTWEGGNCTGEEKDTHRFAQKGCRSRGRLCGHRTQRRPHPGHRTHCRGPGKQLPDHRLLA